MVSTPWCWQHEGPRPLSCCSSSRGLRAGIQRRGCLGGHPPQGLWGRSRPPPPASLCQSLRCSWGPPCPPASVAWGRGLVVVAGAGPGVSQPLRRRPGNPLTCPLPPLPWGGQSQLVVITMAGNEPPTAPSHTGCPPPHTHTKPTPAPQGYHLCLHPRHLLVTILTSPRPHIPTSSPPRISWLQQGRHDSEQQHLSPPQPPCPHGHIAPAQQMWSGRRCLAWGCPHGDTVALSPTRPPQEVPSAQRHPALVL